ncbi:MAG: hypothetical protein AAB895_02980 [Patescibacteria group bacterium]
MNDDEIKTTEDNKEDFTDDYAVALDNTPEEVRNFIWSEAFKLILKAIGDTYRLNDEQRDVVRRVTIETLIGNITPIARQIRLSDVGMTGELQDNILEAINDEVISRALVQIELTNQEESQAQELEQESKSGPSENMSAPSPAQALANIQERLTKPSTVAPITRDYSVSRNTESTPKDESSSRAPSMDIYREIPEI